MQWIYKNEDKVWRDRGGRPGEETLTSFTSLVEQQPQHSHAPIPGLLAFNCAQSLDAKVGESIFVLVILFL